MKVMENLIVMVGFRDAAKEREKTLLKEYHVCVLVNEVFTCLARRKCLNKMSALFNFQSLLLVVLLLICTCTYVRAQATRLMDRYRTGFYLFFPLNNS